MAWVSVSDLGQNGYKLVKAATTITGSFGAVQCLGRTTFTSLVDAMNPDASWDGVSCADGTILRGHFTWGGVSLGAAIFYNM